MSTKPEFTIEKRFDKQHITIGPPLGGGTSICTWSTIDESLSSSTRHNRPSVEYTNNLLGWKVIITDPTVMGMVNGKGDFEEEKRTIAKRCIRAAYENVGCSALIMLIEHPIELARQKGIKEGRKQKIDEFNKFLER